MTGKFDNLKEFKKKTIDADQQFWEFNVNLKKYCRGSTHGSYTFVKNREFIKWNDLMENIQYNNMQ